MPGVEVQEVYSRDTAGVAAGVQQGYSRGAAGVQQGCSRGAAGVQQGCSRATAGLQQGYSRATARVQQDGSEQKRQHGQSSSKAADLGLAAVRGWRVRGSTIWLASSSSTTSKDCPSSMGSPAEQHVTPTTATLFSFFLRCLSAPCTASLHLVLVVDVCCFSTLI